MGTVRFDDSLLILSAVIAAELGESALAGGTVLRDAVGRLAFFADTAIDNATAERISERLRKELGAYARTDRAVAGADDYGANSVLQDASALQIVCGPHRIRLVDRRLVGADWLRAPVPAAPPPPRFVFASLKGGVGRSTALTVVAAHLAAHGQRVLAIDLDMEAPGLGSLLLTRETLPEFGILDALVENNLSGLDETFYADLIGPSALARHGGRIDVIPAFGTRSLKNPSDVLAKIARAYAEDVKPDGTVATLLDQVHDVVAHYSDPNRYDIILIDARAGLHETTASAILGLGAEVLLFGLDEPQTFHGYAALLAHLSRFLPQGKALPEWAERLTMVQGKAPADANVRAGFAQRCQELFGAAGFGGPPPASTDVPLPAGPFNQVPWDDELPDEQVLPDEWSIREPLAVLNDTRFQLFQPYERRDLLENEIYQTTFGMLIKSIEDALQVKAEG